MGKINPQFFRIKNWDSFQHYRDRNPKWVKLHFETLFSRDWITLDDHGRALMVVCMLVGSRHNGQVPNDIGYLTDVGHLKGNYCLNSLVACGFLDPPKRWRNKGNVATKPLRNAIPERESEIEVEKNKKDLERKALSKPRTRIGAYQPSEFEQAKAAAYWRSKGREDLIVADQLERFTAFHTGKGTVMVDWPRTWQTWYMNAIQFSKEQKHGRPTPHDKFLAGGLLALDRFGKKPGGGSPSGSEAA